MSVKDLLWLGQFGLADGYCFAKDQEKSGCGSHLLPAITPQLAFCFSLCFISTYDVVDTLFHISQPRRLLRAAHAGDNSR